jgi:phosphoadenosine phosphosulfate reductase
MTTLRTVAVALERHRRVALLFSGGKDALACLYLLRPWWDRVDVVWVNTGDAFAEVVEQMARIRTLVPRFHEVHANAPAQIAANGWPVEALPIAQTVLGRVLERHARQLLQPYTACCTENILTPAMRAVAELGATLVIRGERREECRRGAVESGQVWNGVEWLLPIFDWTLDDVWTFLREQGAEVPAYYATCSKSIDCRLCTAQLSDAAAGEAQYLREHHPDAARERARRLKVIREALGREVDLVDQVLGELAPEGE